MRHIGVGEFADDAVELRRADERAGIELLEPAFILNPLGHEVRDIELKDGRRIGNAVGTAVDAVVEKRRHLGSREPEQITPKNHDRKTGDAEILLRGGPDEAESIDVHGPRHEVARHVRDERHVGRVRQHRRRRKFHAVDGFVVAIRAVARFRKDFELFIGGRSRARPGISGLHAPEPERFLCGRLAPGARDDVGRKRPGSQEIHGHHRKLHAPAALAEKDVVIVGHLEERADPGLQVPHDLRNLRSPVACLENRKAESLIVEELRLDPREHRLRQHRRTGSEIERSFHGNPHQTQARQKDRA